jgi:hypothetical protein
MEASGRPTNMVSLAAAGATSRASMHSAVPLGSLEAAGVKAHVSTWEGCQAASNLGSPRAASAHRTSMKWPPPTPLAIGL